MVYIIPYWYTGEGSGKLNKLLVSMDVLASGWAVHSVNGAQVREAWSLSIDLKGQGDVVSALTLIVMATSVIPQDAFLMAVWGIRLMNVSIHRSKKH
jgi:hypothetical protein